MKFDIGDKVWVQTTDYCASRAYITGVHQDGYYVSFVDKTSDQESTAIFPVLERQVRPLDYIGWEK